MSDEIKGGDPRIQREAKKFAIQQLAQRITEQTGVDPHALMGPVSNNEDFEFRQIDSAAFDQLSALQQALVLLVYDLEESMRGEQYCEENNLTDDEKIWHELEFDKYLDEIEESGDDRYTIRGSIGSRSNVSMSGFKEGRGIVTPKLTNDDLRLVEEIVGFDPDSAEEIDDQEKDLLPSRWRDELSLYGTNIPDLYAGKGLSYSGNTEQTVFLQQQTTYGARRDLHKAWG